jgi:uracil-DNA glycosylase family 4
MFYVTNATKCYPRLSKSPDKSSIEICGEWLREEILTLQPCLILAFGNTGLKAFNKQSRITLENGKTEWRDDMSTFISWCVHPSSVLHNPANKELFETGIKNFAAKVSEFGVIKIENLLSN